MRRLPVLVLLCVISTIFSCADQPSSQPTGETRLVVISPALGRIVADLGVGGMVVGRHSWDRAFPEAPSVGDQASIDYEVLRRLEPTHVLLQWGDRPLPARLVSLAERESWEVANVEILSLDDIAGATRSVAAFCGDDAARARAEELVGDLSAALAPREGFGERAGRVVSLYGVSPLGIAGAGSFTHEMLERLGADSVPDTGAPFIAMDPEDLRRLDPDTVVFFAPNADGEERRELTAALERFDLRAARKKRVVFVTHADALLPSTAMVEVAWELGRAFERLDGVE